MYFNIFLFILNIFLHFLIHYLSIYRSVCIIIQYMYVQSISHIHPMKSEKEGKVNHGPALKSTDMARGAHVSRE
jgi:hypothetical protein